MLNFFQQSYAIFLGQRLYSKRFQQYGKHSKGVLWSNYSRQIRRYELLMQGISNKSSINDFGCGYGGLYEYILQRGYQGQYRGYDINHQMIASAIQQFPSVQFVRSKKINQYADYTIISGTLNLKMSASHTVWWDWIQKQLLHCWMYSKKGFHFNLLLDVKNKPKSPNLFYCTEQLIEGFCANELSTNSTIQYCEDLDDIHVFVAK